MMRLSKIKGLSPDLCDLYEAAAYAASEHKLAPRFMTYIRAIMGRVHLKLHYWYRKLLRLTSSAELFDDQHAAVLLHQIGNIPVMLDYTSTVFQTMHESTMDLTQQEPFALYKNSITNTNSTPAVLHFNGNKAPLNKFAAALWFNKPGVTLLDSSKGSETVEDEFVPYATVC